MNDAGTTVRLSAAQLASFEEHGFLRLDRLLDEDDLRPLEDEYARLLGDVAGRLHREGRIPSSFEDAPFAERFARVLSHCPDLHRFFNISLPLINGEIDAGSFHVHTGPAVFSLLRNRRILDVVESVIGPEICSSPVQQMRMKPPAASLDPAGAVHSNVGATTWHQDVVALLPEADDTRQLTVWVAISEASEKNGCLVCVPGSHRHGPVIHCANRVLASEPGVPPALLEGRAAVPLPVDRGGVVLFHKLTLHRALANRSRRLRWSADLRYHPVGQPSGRPAFPGFVARSRARPASELRDHREWARRWDEARTRILSGRHRGPIFADSRWSDPAVC